MKINQLIFGAFLLSFGWSIYAGVIACAQNSTDYNLVVNFYGTAEIKIPPDRKNVVVCSPYQMGQFTPIKVSLYDEKGGLVKELSSNCAVHFTAFSDYVQCQIQGNNQDQANCSALLGGGNSTGYSSSDAKYYVSYSSKCGGSTNSNLRTVTVSVSPK